MPDSIKMSDDCIAAYERGCETTKAAIEKFGYTFAKDALTLNHPQRLKGNFKSEEAYQHTKGCFDTLKAAKRR